LWLLPPHRLLDNNEARFSLVRCTYSADVKVRPDISYDINNIQHTRERERERDNMTIGEESFRWKNNRLKTYYIYEKKNITIITATCASAVAVRSIGVRKKLYIIFLTFVISRRDLIIYRQRKIIGVAR